MKGPLFVVGLAILALWLLAVASMLGGNSTAVNAVLGIPFGCVLGGSLIWLVTRVD